MAKQKKRLWDPKNFESPKCTTEFGDRNQLEIDFNEFKIKMKKLGFRVEKSFKETKDKKWICTISLKRIMISKHKNPTPQEDRESALKEALEKAKTVNVKKGRKEKTILRFIKGKQKIA